MDSDPDFTTEPSNSETKCEQLANQDGNEGSATNGACGNRNNPFDKRTKYAIAVQNACTDALQRVVKSNVQMHRNWAAPLAAAPTAISIMAICLKTAAEKQAAGLEIADLKVTDESGSEVIGTLPSKYFHTNLQHCSDIGRLAFLDAQKRMSTVNSVARSMIEDDGSIGYIVDLLEDPEDAKYNLKPEIEQVRETAEDCLKNAKAMTHKFEYWHRVIIHLKQTSLSRRGEIIKEKGDTEEQKSDAKVRADKYTEDKLAAQKEIDAMRVQLEQAQRNVARAQADVDDLKRLPQIAEPSEWEEAMRAQKIVRDTETPKIERGFFSDVGSLLFGKSKVEVDEDEATKKQHHASLERQRHDYMAKAKAQREAERKKVGDRLYAAREVEEQLGSKVTAAVEKLSASDYRLAEAKANLSKTGAELKRLGKSELELNSIMKILDKSTHQLGLLKEQIEPLVLFFNTILSDIDKTFKKDVESFLKIIERGIVDGENPDEVASIQLREASKKRVLTTALQIQGSFSVIADISGGYVQISERFIRPAINRMESLATVSDREWDAQSGEFIEWCQNAVIEIDVLARNTSKKMEQNMVRQINALQKRAIEAAENDN